MDNYTYSAFISYNHLDERYARKLQYKLEHYKLPTVARKEIGEEAKLTPIFRYVSDLSLGDLREQVIKELDASRYLIVICSPNSAQPNVKGEHWVNDEVSHFMRIGRADRIIPVIVDGEPKCGDPARECFPPVLREAEILGVDWKREGSVAIQRIVAKLLSLKPDQLIQRWLRDKRRRARQMVLGMIPAALGLLALGWFAWDGGRTVKAYYADYVDSYGLPYGIFELSGGDTKHRSVHYRFEWRGLSREKSVHADCAPYSVFSHLGFHRVLRRVVQAHSSGTPRNYEFDEYSSRPPIMEFARYEGGVIREIRHCEYNGDDKPGKLQKRLLYSDDHGVVNGHVRFAGDAMSSSKFMKSALNGGDGSSDHGSTRISQCAYERDPNGRTVSVRYQNSVGEPTCDGDGVYGQSYQLDACGRIVNRLYTGEDGRMTVTSKGVAGIRYEYHPTGSDLLGRVHYGRVGSPVIGPFGWSRCVGSYDEFGNVTRISYFGTGGEGVLCKEGYSTIVSSYDERGDLTSATCLDAVGNPIAEAENNIISSRFSYDDRGFIVRMENCDADGNRMSSNEGWSIAEITLDDAGRTVACKFLDVNGVPIRVKDGYAERHSSYDATGNQTGEKYFDESGKPVRGDAGIAEIRADYDDQGRITGTSAYDENGVPTSGVSGAARVRYEYDAYGNQVCAAIFGVDGSPVNNTSGVHRQVDQYDESGRVVRRRYFDKGGALTFSADGYAQETADYDRHGNMITNRFWGTAGEPVCQKDGVSSMVMSYDDRGNEIGKSYYNADGCLAMQINGSAGYRQEWNSKGECTRAVFLGLDGKPKKISDGYAELHCEYDAHGKECRRSYFDEEGRPCRVGGFASLSGAYDECGRLIEKRGLDENGRPVDGKDGYSVVKYGFDAFGRNVSIRYFAADGSKTVDAESGCHGCDMVYDRLGHQISCQYIGVDGGPVAHKEGNASWRAEFDADGNEVRRVYVGTDGLPVCLTNGYAEIRVQYDKRRFIIREEYFDEKGARVLVGADQVAGYTYERDSVGNDTLVMFIGTDGMPTAGPEGAYGLIKGWDRKGHVTSISRIGKNGDRIAIGEDGLCETRFAYNELGKMCEVSYHDVSGRLIVSGAYAKATSTFDRYGNETSVRYFLADGTLLPIGSCHAYEVKEFDALGRELACRYFDHAGRRCNCEDGYSAVISKYDANGHNIESWFADVNDEIVAAIGQVAGCSKKFDGAGNVIEHLWRGVNKEVVNHPDGNAGWRAEYDKNGKEIRREFFSASGGLCAIQKSGMAGYAKEYDGNGNCVTTSHFGVDRKPCASDEGWMRQVCKFDDRGRVIRTLWFDEHDEPMCIDAENKLGSSEDRYDDKGNLVSQRHFDLDGKPMMIPHGGYGWNAEYNDAGKMVKQSFVDAEGSHMLIGEIAYVTFAYDPFGNLVRRTRHGSDGRQVCGFDGTAETRREFDSFGHETFVGYYGADGAPVLGPEGYSQSRRTYDGMGQLVAVRYLGADGKPIMHNERKHATERWEYDEAGNVKVYVRYDAEGRIIPIEGEPTVGYVFRKCDGRGLVLSEMYYGLNEEIALNSLGIAGRENIYDDTGRVVKCRFLDLNKRPAFVKGMNIAGWKVSFERVNGRDFKKVAWLDKHDRPVKHPEGNCGFVNELDGAGGVREQTYVDEYGRPVTLKAGCSKVMLSRGADGVVERLLFFDVQGDQVFPQGDRKLQEEL